MRTSSARARQPPRQARRGEIQDGAASAARTPWIAHQAERHCLSPPISSAATRLPSRKAALVGTIQDWLEARLAATSRPH